MATVPDHPPLPPAWRVRHARPSELRQLAAVEDSGGALFRAHLGEDLPAALLAPAPSGLDRAALPGCVLVAVHGTDQEVVGFAHVVDHDHEEPGAVHLEQLSVLPSHGRRGIGTALVRAAEEEARWWGAGLMTLTTYRDLPWNGPLYARLGYAEQARPPAYVARALAAERAAGLDLGGAVAAGPRVAMSRRLGRRGA
ncbi:hypothetical protein GCM10009719_03330 [Nocardioides kribbensis]